MNTTTAQPATAHMHIIDPGYWGITYEGKKVGFITKGTEGFLAHVYNELGTYTRLTDDLLRAATWIRDEVGANYVTIPKFC